VEQQRAVHAIEGHADVRRPKSAQRKLGAEVVAGRDARPHLHGAKQVVCHQATECQ
jgi:hypothetical protein